MKWNQETFENAVGWAFMAFGSFLVLMVLFSSCSRMIADKQCSIGCGPENKSLYLRGKCFCGSGSKYEYKLGD